MQIFTFMQVIERLATFARDAQDDEFKEIFGDVIGRHLFEKFAYIHNFDLLSWYCNLDLENRGRLIAYLEAKEAKRGI